MTRHRRRDRDCDEEGSGLRRFAAPAPSRGFARGEAGQRNPGIVCRVRLAGGEGQRHPAGAAAGPPRPARAGTREDWSADPSHTDDPRSRVGRRMAEAVRRSGPRRGDCQAGGRYLPAGQACDAQNQARADRRMRGCRVPLAQEWTRRRGLAAPGPVRRQRNTAPRRRHLRIHHGSAKATGHGTGTTRRERIEGSSLARVDGRGRTSGQADARWPEPVERRQGPLLGTAAPRACLRGEIRPPAGRPFPARDGLPAVASRQAAVRLPLRPARGHDPLRAREGLRGLVHAPTSIPFHGSSSGSSGSCAGRRPSGTFFRFSRMRHHVELRPRIESTSTSSGARCLAASACRSRQRSRPASASAFCNARPTSIRGCDDTRRREGCARVGSPFCLW